MTWVAVAIGGAALVGAGASVYASNQQASGQQAAQQTAQNEFNTINKQEQPKIMHNTPIAPTTLWFSFTYSRSGLPPGRDGPAR